MLAIVFFSVCALCAVLLFSIGIKRSLDLKNNLQEHIDYGEYIRRQTFNIIGFTVAFTGMLIWIYPWANIQPKIYESIQAILGGMVFSSSIAIAVNSFIVHYYCKGLPEKLDKVLFATTVSGFALSAITLFVTLNGFADYMTYPLVNGFSFLKGFVQPDEGSNIAFYAVCILCGAIMVYFLCDHKLYMEYGKHGLLESTFLVAFPAGIIGARIFYVIGNFNVPSSQGGFDGVFDWHVFAIWNGGLTILGGAIVGIVVGVAWFMWRNKGYSIWVTVDIAVPTILLAQAVGRWGNFFNCEVHGLPSDETLWYWLPRVVYNNVHWSTSTGSPTQLTDGTLYVPLFLIESLVNIFGYTLLAHVFGKALRKSTELGDLAFGYVIWYGLTRTLMEPLRDPAYNMGEDGYWSWVWSMIFVVAGCLLIVGNHLVRYFIRKKKNEPTFRPTTFKNSSILSIALGVVTIALVIVGTVLMINGTFTGKIAYNSFNLGLIILILGISFLLITIIPVFNMISSKKVAQVNE